ncbi:MAG: hypothetical protein AAF583_12185 [Pseudomonadota bacterium]
MGSTGTGKFSDYSSSGGGTGSGGGSGGKDSVDRCKKAFTDQLQDVEHSEYFSQNRAPPPKGTILTLRHEKRIEAVDANNLSVGSLPTGLNYLADCLASGFEYAGEVISSSSGPIVKVMVSFAPVE